MKKKFICILILFLLVVSICNFTQAANFVIKVNTSKTSLTPGSDVTITARLTGYTTNDVAVDTIRGIISYDKNIFEAITKTNITGLNTWTVTEYNDSISYFILENNDPTNQDQSIISIKLKVKDNVAVGTTTTVTLKDVEMSDGTNDITPTVEATTTITIANDAADDNGINNNTNIIENENNVVPESTPTPTPTPQASTPTPTPNTNKNISNQAIPDAGLGTGMIIVLSVVVITSLISYLKYRGLGI